MTFAALKHQRKVHRNTNIGGVTHNGGRAHHTLACLARTWLSKVEHVQRGKTAARCYQGWSPAQ